MSIILEIWIISGTCRNLEEKEEGEEHQVPGLPWRWVWKRGESDNEMEQIKQVMRRLCEEYVKNVNNDYMDDTQIV